MEPSPKPPGEPRGDPPPFRVRSLTAAVYLPNFLFAVGRGAAIPILPLLALDLGASAAAAGAIVALRGIGTMMFDVPAGVLVARLGERRAMGLATGLLAAIALAIANRPSLPVYAALVLVMGCAWSVWALARLAYATESSPPGHRGRVMSVIGGAGRMGQFLGPLVGGLAIIPLGLPGPFLVQAGMAVVASAMLSAAPPAPSQAETGSPGDHAVVTLRGIVRDHRRTLGTAGVVAIAVQVLRGARQAIIPLWGDAIGLGAGSIALIFSASSAAEMVLFYPVGILMDRKGRKWAAIPCIALLSLGTVLIPLTTSAASLSAVALLMGVANGLGVGINSTLASDLSPAVGRNQFLGVWRLVTDVGTAGGPLLVAATTSLASLGAAALVVGAVGATGALVLWLAVPESLAERA